MRFVTNSVNLEDIKTAGNHFDLKSFVISVTIFNMIKAF